LLLVSFC